MKPKKWAPLVKKVQTRLGVHKIRAEFKITPPDSKNPTFNGEVVCRLKIEGFWSGSYTSKVHCCTGDVFSKVDGQMMAFDRAIAKHWKKVGKAIFGKQDAHLLTTLILVSTRGVVFETQQLMLMMSKIFHYAIEKSAKDQAKPKKFKALHAARKVLKRVIGSAK